MKYRLLCRLDGRLFGCYTITSCNLTQKWPGVTPWEGRLRFPPGFPQFSPCGFSIPPDSSRSPKTFILCNLRQRCQGIVLPVVQCPLCQLIEWNDAPTDGDLHARLDKQQTFHSNRAFLRWYRSLTVYMEAQRLCLKVSTATQDLQ